jgi:RNA polymerase sigma factor (sigma-70 family)
MGPSTTLEPPLSAPTRSGRPRDRVAAHALATDVARLHGDALLRTARRFADDPDDAHDAYQRALELLLEHAATIDRNKALSWMHVVVRREASALRRRHDRHIPFDVDAVDQHQVSDRTDEHLSAIDLAQRAGEALAALKESEAQALCLRAQGLSYEEIADTYGWSYTKVNRAVSEGRRAFAEHYLGAERGDICDDAGQRLRAYIAGELRARDHVRVRAHLARCSACRAQLHAERGAGRALQALLPPVIPAATHPGWFHDHLLAPLGELAARLAPATDQALGAKVGVAAISVAAIAGGSTALERQAAAPPPPALHARLIARPPADKPAAAQPAVAPANALQSAADAGQRIAETARDRAAAAARKAAARKKAAAARNAAARSAVAREFAPATNEFSGDSAPSPTAARRATADTSSGNTVTPGNTDASPPIEVQTSASSPDDAIAVTDATAAP